MRHAIILTFSTGMDPCPTWQNFDLAAHYITTFLSGFHAAIAAIMDTLDFAYSTNFDNFAFLLCTSQTFKTSFMLLRKVRAFVWAQIWLDRTLRSRVTQLQRPNFGVLGVGQNCKNVLFSCKNVLLSQKVM